MIAKMKVVYHAFNYQNESYDIVPKKKMKVMTMQQYIRPCAQRYLIKKKKKPLTLGCGHVTHH